MNALKNLPAQFYYTAICRGRGWWMSPISDPGKASKLYRLLTVGMLGSALSQAALRRTPLSVQQQVPSYLDWVFIGSQLIGAILICAAIWVKRMDSRDAAYAELAGCLLLATALINYSIVIAATAYPPISQAQWICPLLALYLFGRALEVLRVIVTVGAISRRRSR